MLLNNQAIDYVEGWVKSAYRALCDGKNDKAVQLFRTELRMFVGSTKDYHFLAKICQVKLFNHLPLWYCIFMARETNLKGIKSTAWDDYLISLEKRIRKEHHDPSLLLKGVRFT